MHESFCSVPAHKLACQHPDFQREYDALAAAQSKPAEFLDRKAYHALTLKSKKRKGSVADDGYMARRGRQR